MINISSRNKIDIKEGYDNLFSLVGLNRNMEACNAIDELEMNIRKYHISRGIIGNGIDKTFYDIKYALTHYTRNEWRRQAVYKLLETLSKQISGCEENIPIKTKISSLYSDIRDDFRTLCMTGNPRDMDSLMDDFESLQKISTEINKLGSDVYTAYELVMKDAGKCQAILPKLMPQLKNQKWVVTKESIGAITASFELLYSNINMFIALLDEPESEEKPVKKLSEKTMLDMDETKEKVMIAEMRQLFRENWPADEIARRFNMTTNELFDLLGLEEE